MSAATAMTGAARRSRLVGLSIWLLLPLCALSYQMSAKEVALHGAAAASVGAWLDAMIHSPWSAVLVASDVVGFFAWMVVLGEMQLSAAFSMSALSYVLVIACSWIVFHEPGGVTQVMGSAAIMVGVYLMSRADQPADGIADELDFRSAADTAAKQKVRT